MFSPPSMCNCHGIGRAPSAVVSHTHTHAQSKREQVNEPQERVKKTLYLSTTQQESDLPRLISVGYIRIASKWGFLSVCSRAWHSSIFIRMISPTTTHTAPNKCITAGSTLSVIYYLKKLCAGNRYPNLNAAHRTYLASQM